MLESDIDDGGCVLMNTSRPTFGIVAVLGLVMWTITGCIPLGSSAPAPVNIVPVPLPTTVPNQRQLIKQAADEAGKNVPVSVDFVVDLTEYSNEHLPKQLQAGDNWYKYTHTGKFSVLMHASSGVHEFDFVTTTNIIGDIGDGFEAIYSNVKGQLVEDQVVQQGDDYELANGGITPAQELDRFDPSWWYGSLTNLKVIQDQRIQLNGMLGRELIFTFTLDDRPNLTLRSHGRLYVAGRTIYSVFFTRPNNITSQAENHFLDSFTLLSTTK